MSKIIWIVLALSATFVMPLEAMEWFFGPQTTDITCYSGQCTITYNGSKNMTYRIPDNCNHLTVNNRGSGDITLISKHSIIIPTAIVTNSGSNTLDMSQVKIKDMILYDRGSAVVSINVTESLKGQGNGSGIIYYRGNPDMSQFKTHNWDNVIGFPNGSL